MFISIGIFNDDKGFCMLYEQTRLKQNTTCWKASLLYETTEH